MIYLIAVIARRQAQDLNLQWLSLHYYNEPIN